MYRNVRIWCADNRIWAPQGVLMLHSPCRGLCSNPDVRIQFLLSLSSLLGSSLVFVGPGKAIGDFYVSLCCLATLFQWLLSDPYCFPALILCCPSLTSLVMYLFCVAFALCWNRAFSSVVCWHSFGCTVSTLTCFVCRHPSRAGRRLLWPAQGPAPR